MLRVPQNRPGHKLRGPVCCAISERPTPSLFAAPSLFRILSPIIPVHRCHSAVSPIIPVHTQKQGGGGCVIHMVTCLKYVGAPTFSFRESSIAIRQNADSSSALAVNCQLSTVNCPSPPPLATAALRVVPAPIFTTTLSTHVGARCPPTNGGRRQRVSCPYERRRKADPSRCSG